ncbi:MAG TPA: peptidoglycan-associated lipoprotein Pal, partial [Gammaproteobacteria bacterium]|nr:peptidoglycan-associated lipoprotein Pal [Gammaproteobacteria bacterium]
SSSGSASSGSSSSGSVAGNITSAADTLATIGNTVYFSYDSAALDGNSKGTLFRQAAFLNANPALTVTIEGHCDERGTREYNLALGERRANSVSEIFQAMGVAPDAIRTISYGEERPISMGQDESAWSLNRRVEILY